MVEARRVGPGPAGRPGFIYHFLVPRADWSLGRQFLRMAEKHFLLFPPRKYVAVRAKPRCKARGRTSEGTQLSSNAA